MHCATLLVSLYGSTFVVKNTSTNAYLDLKGPLSHRSIVTYTVYIGIYILANCGKCIAIASGFRSAHCFQYVLNRRMVVSVANC